jgi:hypothetical protein
MTQHSFTRALLPLAVATMVAACGGGGSSQTLTPKAKPTTHQVSDTDRGGTVQAKVGDDIVVTLHSTYWQLSKPSGGVLVGVGSPQTAAGGPSCPTVPGTGCGTIRADYRVEQPGKTEIRASRTSCGEAMRCTGSAGRWSVTISATR